MIEIYGSCNLRGYKKALKNFLNFVLKKEKNSKFKKIFIIFTNDNKIRKLNKKFLNKDEKTDVLSFEINDIGEIYVNVDFAKTWEFFLLCCILFTSRTFAFNGL